MGCGPGPNFRPLREDVGETGEIVGIDVARGALGRARAHVRRADWENVHPLRADATEPPIDQMDAVIATFVIGMFDDPASVVRTWCDCVGSGGRVGLLHFARSDRWYGPAVNLPLRALVIASTPGKQRLRTDATDLLDRRVRDGQNALRDRCDVSTHTTHWGGMVHIVTGRVA